MDGLSPIVSVMKYLQVGMWRGFRLEQPRPILVQLFDFSREHGIAMINGQEWVTMHNATRLEKDQPSNSGPKLHKNWIQGA